MNNDKAHIKEMKGMIQEIKKDIMRYAAKAQEYIDLISDCERQVKELEAEINKIESRF